MKGNPKWCTREVYCEMYATLMVEDNPANFKLCMGCHYAKGDEFKYKTMHCPNPRCVGRPEMKDLGGGRYRCPSCHRLYAPWVLDKKKHKRKKRVKVGGRNKKVYSTPKSARWAC